MINACFIETSNKTYDFYNGEFELEKKKILSDQSHYNPEVFSPIVKSIEYILRIKIRNNERFEALYHRGSLHKILLIIDGKYDKFSGITTKIEMNGIGGISAYLGDATLILQKIP